MWQELKDSNELLLALYRDVMAKMDKFYANMTVENYKKFLRRGDRGFYWTDGTVDYFLMFHWNGAKQLWKIQCVGFQGTTDSLSMAKLCVAKMADFMNVMELTQMYAMRPKLMDDQYINEHHAYVMGSLDSIVSEVQAETVKEYLCSFTLSPTTKTGV